MIKKILINNINKINKIFLIQIFIFLGWVSMWVSINSMPGELAYMNKDIITFINGMRSIFAIIFSCLTVILATSLLFKNSVENNPKSLILIIFFIHFSSQLVGLILNEERLFNLNNIYLVLYAACVISILYIIKIKNFQKLILFFMYFVLFILIISIIFVCITNLENIKNILNQENLYYLLHPDKSLAYQAPPRITGLSRSIAIINIFLIISFLIDKKKYSSYLLLICIYFLSIIIWMAQSRGTIICFYLSSAILIFFLNNLHFFKKILLYCTITLFAILVANYVNKINLKTITKTNDIVKEEISDDTDDTDDKFKLSEVKDKMLNFENSRFVTNKKSSGRTTLWKVALTKYDGDKKFGYGPQADRIILYEKENIYGNNSSNALIYALLSGGYPSFISILLVYFYFIYLITIFFVKRKLYKLSFKLSYENRIYITSITFCIFFLTRSLIENSFAVFSIDFLITILSLYIIEQSKHKKII